VSTSRRILVKALAVTAMGLFTMAVPGHAARRATSCDSYCSTMCSPIYNDCVSNASCPLGNADCLDGDGIFCEVWEYEVVCS
jgi:hypothetical protein